jgi:nucleotide-binding universal stress UspA family protein
MQTENKKNTILVPTDFSQVADNALNHAINVAKVFGNDICILHIFEDSLIGSVWGQKNSYKDGMVGQMLQEKMERMAADIKKEHNINVKALIKSGRIYSTIVGHAEEEENDIDSIIMGTNGASGIEQLIGSTASRVMSHSPVPVVVVKEKQYDNGYNNIVMPIDLTMESKQKVWWAIHLAKKYDCTIHIISIHEDDEFLKNRINANLLQVEEVLNKNGIKYTTRILDDKNYPGNPADDTLQYAEEINADLIMIMTQQEKGGFSEYIIGSYAQQIVNKHSSVPVMCINPKKTGFKTELWSGI